MMDATEIKQGLKPYELFINGLCESPVSQRTIPVINPATGKHFGGPLSTIPFTDTKAYIAAMKAAGRMRNCCAVSRTG